MDTLIDLMMRFFDRLPNALKLLLLVLLVGTVVWLTIGVYRNRLRVRELERQLQEATRERDELQKRFIALDQVGVHVWRRPDAFAKNQFVRQDQRRTRFIAVSNLKGGVGKTATTVNLGACWALRGKRVLLVDLDFQGTLSNLLIPGNQLLEYRANEWATDAMLRAGAASAEVLRQAPSIERVALAGGAECRVMIARRELELAEYEQQSRFFVNPENPDREVRFLFQRLLHTHAVFDKYDYVLFDCPPRMTTACVNALTCADYILIPTTLNLADIEAVERTLGWLRDLKELGIVRGDLLGVVVARYKMRGGKVLKAEEGNLDNLTKRVQQQLRIPGANFVTSAKIPDSPKISRADPGYPLVLASKEGRRWFDQLCQELEGRMQG